MTNQNHGVNLALRNTIFNIVVLLIMGMLEKLPNEILEHILYNVDQETLRLKCIDVCNKWRNIIQSVQFWKRYHRYWYDHILSNAISYPFLKGSSSYIPEDMFRGDYDWILFSYINPQENPFQRNLLRNSDGNHFFSKPKL